MTASLGRGVGGEKVTCLAVWDLLGRDEAGPSGVGPPAFGARGCPLPLAPPPPKPVWPSWPSPLRLLPARLELGPKLPPPPASLSRVREDPAPV